MTAAAQRTLVELVDTKEPGIDLVRQWFAEASNDVELLSCSREDGELTLLALQVTTRSPLGAVAYETGGLLIDHGWLRILGAGCPRLPRGLADWNGLDSGDRRLPGALLVGDDAVGGFFAVNGDGLPGPAGNVFYLAPDTLEWEDLELGYSAWLRWTLSGDLAGFYESFRWDGWRGEVSELSGDRAFSIIPFLFTEGPPVGERSRRPVPIEELWGLYAIELPRQLGMRREG